MGVRVAGGLQHHGGVRGEHDVDEALGVAQAASERLVPIGAGARGVLPRSDMNSGGRLPVRASIRADRR